jgi:predicted GIY-YIG superfamily endonuclease
MILTFIFFASLSDSFADSSANKSTLSRKESSRQLAKTKQSSSPLELVQFDASNKINQLEVRIQNRIVYNVPAHDITKYTDKPCVYLFHLRGNEYKYGVTDDILKRAKDHQGEFGKYGIVITLEEIYECRSTAVARLVESRIKTFAMTRGHDTPVYGKTEIITTEDIDAYAHQIDAYVKIENETHDRVHGLYADNLRLREKELELQIIQAQPTELNIQLMQMKIRIMELENEREIARYRNEIKK